MNGLTSNRFLVIYSAVITVVFAVTVFSGFADKPSNLHLKQLTVQRINVVEPDGKPRMIISDQHDFPGEIIRGHDYPDKTRKVAGILFYNSEGSEMGGLTYTGSKGSNGKPISDAGLSFDKYDQDQTMVLQNSEVNGKFYKFFAINDQPNYPITEEMSLLRQINAHPDHRNALLKKFYASHGRWEHRLFLGETPNKATTLVLKDAKGRTRLLLRVSAKGAPELQFLNAKGKVIEQLPSPKSGRR